MSRPRRFASVDNEAIDCLPSILAVGLLTRLIRAQDGEHVTVETLTEKYDEGEKALSGAMRALVEAAFVVKIKIQRATTETVEDDNGKLVVKRGGTWYTEFSVDSLAFSAEDVAEMVREVLTRKNVKNYRVEPKHLDPKNTGLARTVRPAPLMGGVGPTCENTEQRPAPLMGGVGPTCENTEQRPARPNRRAGRAGTAQGGALIKEETVVENSLSSAGGDSGAEPEREAAAPGTPSPLPPAAGVDLAGVVVDAYERAAGYRMVNGTRRVFREQAVALLAAGRSVEWLAARAAEMPAHGWVDLARHVNHPQQRPAPVGGGGGVPGEAPRATPEQIAALRARLLERGTGL
ncbi:hypothetical protein GCM10010232_70830 [Streptomyces amakusaensis]